MKVTAPPRRFEIVSGGQTGVDRGALDSALDLGVECGGWCPPGRLAEDGRVPDRYPLVELEEAEYECDGYTARTRRNVEISDGTLILCAGPPSGGTALTLKVCRELRKPVIIINGRLISAQEAGAHAEALVAHMGIRRLNVAGPRASQWPDGYAYTREVVRRLLGRGGSDPGQVSPEARTPKR